MAYNPNNPNGSATSANSSPVVIASDQGAIPITDNAGSITVDGTVTVSGTVTANAGTGTQNVSVQNASIPVTDNGGSLTVDGSVSISNFPATQPVSGTVAATQSGTWNVGLSTGANAIGSITNTSFAATQATAASLLNKPYGAVTTAAPTYTTGTDNALSLTTAGALRIDGSATTQPISGTVTANAGTGTQNVSVQNASLAVTGAFFQATQPISGTVTANAGTGSFTVAQATAANLNATVTGTVAATQSGTWNVGLNTGANAIGSITNTSFAATQATAANLNATVVGTGTFAVQADTELPAAAALADGAANPTAPTVGAAGLVYNGATWDRAEGANVLDGNAATTLNGVLSVKNSSKRLNPAALGTATNSAVSVDVNGSNNVTVSISTTTTGTFVIEGTGDNTNWNSVEVYDIFADLWVSGQSLTPTAGKVYSILAGGLRQVRIRTNATLGATVTNLWVLDNTQEFIAGIDTGAAPHNFGYTLVHKDGEYSTAQTGTALWTPTTGKKFVVTDLTISTGGTTAGIVTLWQGAAADTTYTVGTDAALFRGEFAPSATAKPGAIKSFNVPYISTTVDHILRVTTSAAMTVYIQVNGYEI